LRHKKGVRFYSDRPGKEARGAGGDPVPAAEIYKETKPGQIDPLEKVEKVCGSGCGPCAGGGQSIRQDFAMMPPPALKPPEISDDLDRFFCPAAML